MNERYHVATSYMPKTGQFYDGDQHEQSAKALLASVTAIASMIEQKKKQAALVANFAIQTAAKVAHMGVMTAAADPANLSHLQQIQLIREPIGKPIEYFALENLFAKLNVDMLQAREPIQSTFGNEDYLDPLQETTANEAKYTELEYNLKKLTFKVYTPIEDIMRTIISPQEITLDISQWDLKRRRNAQALKVLDTITEETDVGVIDTIGADAFHSTNNIANNIAKVINVHLTENTSLLTHIGMNNQDFAKYTSNTWTHAGPTNMEFNRTVGAGVAPFPGVSGLTAVIDPMVPEGTAYMIDKKNGARLAEGPKIMRRYYDEEKDAEAIKMSDFNQFKVVQPNSDEVNRKFVTKIMFA